MINSSLTYSVTISFSIWSNK